MRKKLAIFLVLSLLLSLIPYNVSFAANKKVYNLTGSKKIQDDASLNVVNVNLTELKNAQDSEIIWVQDDVLMQPEVEQTLQEKFNNGSEILFVKK